MAATIKVRTAFADESHRDIEFGPFAVNAAAVTNAKTNVKTFNDNISDIAELYLSDDGASCTGIVEAEVIVSTETVYNLNDEN